jgi:hypothetical protein
MDARGVRNPYLGRVFLAFVIAFPVVHTFGGEARKLGLHVFVAVQFVE